MTQVENHKKHSGVLWIVEVFLITLPVLLIFGLLVHYITHDHITNVGRDLLESQMKFIFKTCRDLLYCLYIAMIVLGGILFQFLHLVDQQESKKFFITVIAGIILTSFAYAIAGFLIDLGWIFYFFLLAAMKNYPTQIHKSTYPLNTL